MLLHLTKIRELRSGNRQSLDNLPKITQLKHESTELSGKLHNHQAEIWNHREVTNWPRITQLLSGSTERSGSLPKITQHRG